MESCSGSFLLVNVDTDEQRGIAREIEPALQLFYHIMQMDRTFEDDLGRRSILKLLHLLEDNNPLITEYRDKIHRQNL